jgi:hypothetical protein
MQMGSPLTKAVDIETLKILAANERQFHSIQAGVRGLASTWTLAALAGIAILLQRSNDIIWLFPPFLLVILICLMVNVGLTVLWIIDQMVYQRLFNTNYLAALRLEQQFSSIPPVRAIQALTTQGRSIASWIKFFYIGPILVFAVSALVVAVVSILSPNTTTSPTFDLPGSAMVVMAFLPIVPLVWLIYYAGGVSFFRLVDSISGDFPRILEEKNCRAIIDRHIQWLSAEETVEGAVGVGGHRSDQQR